MRVLMLVQQVDERDWLRGFTVGWIRALAAQVEQVEVITLSQGEAVLPPNVRVQSMGKERGYGKARELREFYRAMGRVIQDVDVIFSHMTPRYTWLATPYALRYGKPQMLWFTHRQISWELQLALAAATWITTASEDSFPIRSPKVHVMGHGIDTSLFSPDGTQPDDPPLIVTAGRISPIKHHHILLEVAGKLCPTHPVRFAVIGDTAAPRDEEYLANLLRRRDELGLSAEQFALVGALPAAELVKWYRRAWTVTNLSPVGLFDKAALEAMLTETLVIPSSPAFDSLLGAYQLRVNAPDDIDGITARVREVLSLSPAQHAKMGADLRARTAAAHGLERLMENMVKLMGTNNQ